MENIETHFVDEIKSPVHNTDAIKTIRNKLYLINEETENIQIRNIKSSQLDQYNKEIIHLSMPETIIPEAIEDDIFIFDDYIINKVDNNGKLSQITPTSLMNNPYFEFLDIASDGNQLYIEGGNSQDILVMSKSANLISRLAIQKEEIYSGKDFCAILDIENNFHIYQKGELSKVINTNNFKQNTSTDRLSKILLEHKKNTKKIDGDIQLQKMNYLVSVITGTDGMYQIMNNGNIYYATENGGVNLGGNWINNERDEVLGMSNSKYTFVFTNNKVGVFDKEKQIGENGIDLDLSRVIGATNDDNFFYFLTQDNNIQRYYVLE